MILTGDFNATIEKKDRIGPTKISAPLKYLINNLQLKDAYRVHNPDELDFTFINRSGGSRIDRIYVEKTLTKSLLSCNHDFYPLSDHKAVIATFKLTNEAPTKPKRARWCLPRDLLDSETFKKIINKELQYDKNKILTGNINHWDQLKTKAKEIAIDLKKRETKERFYLKTFLKNCLKDLQTELIGGKNSYSEFLRIKSLIIQLELDELSRLNLNPLRNPINREKPSSANLIAEKRRGESAFFRKLKSQEGLVYRGEKAISNMIRSHYQEIYKYEEKKQKKWTAISRIYQETHSKQRYVMNLQKNRSSRIKNSHKRVRQKEISRERRATNRILLYFLRTPKRTPPLHFQQHTPRFRLTKVL